ncbi:MAG: efflux RND transporter periplasmic adaptor subunit [Sphingomonadales bacterium]
MLRAIRRHPLLTAFVFLFATLAVLTARKIATREDDQGARRPGPGTIAVSVAPVRSEVFVDQIEALGTAKANESVAITAKVTETVRRVNFDDGMQITAGAILVELTNAEEEAQLAEYRANLAEAKKQHQRISGLVARGNAATSLLDEQIAAVETAQARLDDRMIRAPFSGVLGFRQMSPGTLVTPNSVITTLDDVEIIKLDFQVPEIFIPALRPNQTIIARSVAYPGQAFEGVVTTVSPRVDPATRAVTVRARIPNPDALLRPGMLLSVALIKGQRETLAIPEQALIPVRDQQFVFVIGDDNRAERRLVTIGGRRPGKVEILSGLEAGERVVIEGTMKLRPKAQVRVVSDKERPDREKDRNTVVSQAAGRR